MKAAVYYSNNDIRIEDYPVPDISHGELLLKVQSSGICGSDLMEWYRKPKAPVVLGHEVAGEIAEVDKSVTKFREGDRVVVTHHVPCNTCHYCLTGRHTNCEMIKQTSFYPGGFAEYLKVPEINVDRGTFLLPDNVSYDDATFTEPLGCVIRGQRIAGMSPGKSVAVIGSGITGLLHLQYSISLGAGFTCAVDVNDFKLDSALKFGASQAYNAGDDIKEKIKKNNSRMLADLVIVCAGAESAIYQAFDIVENGGTVLYFAPSVPDLEIKLNFNKLWWSGVNIVSSYAASPADLLVALDMISQGRVNVADMITHRLPLSDISDCFKMVERSEKSLKILVKP